MPRFALLTHDHPFAHLDLFLEADGVLLAWRLVALPVPDVPTAATRSADHRLAYLDYEGPISGGRGSVRRLDGGELVWLTRSEEAIVVEVRGEALVGRLELARTARDEWRLTWRRAGG